MMPDSSQIENLAVYLPITTEIRHVADRFALRQPTPEKAEEVRLNTIAVSIVNNYLKMLGVMTDLASSDSWNQVMQLSDNVADLMISEVGSLECRPVKGVVDSCYIPYPVINSAIGYTVVQIDDGFKKAAILGFTPEITTEYVKFSDLEPLESLIDRIHELKALNNPNSLINLGQWFNNLFDEGWQTLESFFAPEQLIPAFALRSGELFDLNSSKDFPLAKAKLIDFGVHLSDRKVILLIQLNPESHNKVGVVLRILPQPEQIYLPEALELRVLEASERVFMEAQARNRDNYIQLQFSGQVQETFTVEIILNGVKFSQQFQL